MLDLKKSPYFLTDNQIKKINQTINEMSINDKVGQLFFVISPNLDGKELKTFMTTYRPGGMMYRPGTKKELKENISQVQNASGIPLFIAANLESGGNGLLTEGTWVGNPLQISATNDPNHAFYLGNISGNEAKQVGCTMSFSPIVDIDFNFRNPITNTRTFGSDYQKVLDMAKKQIEGLQESRVIPVIKHFPGDGVDERDQHLVSSVNSLSVEKWQESYGKIYQELIDQGILTIMIGHILQPAIEKYLCPTIKDEELRPASCSKLLIDGWLREQLGFNGLAITDATPMIGYNTALKRKQLLIATINAGVDMILFNKNIDEDYRYVYEAIEDGAISISRLDEAVMRILATKYAQQMIEPCELKSIEHQVSSLDTTQKIIEEIARKSVTLVKDRDSLLPLTPTKYPRVRLVILGDSDEGGFKEGGKVGSVFKTKLEEKGFLVEEYDRHHLNFHEIFEEGVEDLKNKFDLALYVANVETASNQTTTRLNWIQLMAADAPWFMREIPTVFVSTANPYHLFDIPNVSTYINGYTGNEITIEAILNKMIGLEEFEGVSPVDPFCGIFDTRL